MSAILHNLPRRSNLSAVVTAIAARPLVYGAALALIGLSVGMASAVGAANKACTGIYNPSSTEIRF